MSDKTDPMVAALARERAMYLSTGRADRIIPVDEQLALRGWCVNAAGDLVKLDDDQEARKQPPKGRRARPTRSAEGDEE